MSRELGTVEVDWSAFPRLQGISRPSPKKVPGGRAVQQ